MTQSGLSKAFKSSLQQIHPDLKLSKEAADYLDTFFYNLCTEIAKHIDKTGSLSNAISKVIKGDLSLHAISEGNKASSDFINKQIPSNLLYKYKKMPNQKENNLFFRAAIGYLIDEIIELSGNCAIDNKHIIVSLDDIQCAFKNDTELKKLNARFSKKITKRKSVKKSRKPKKKSVKKSRKPKRKSVKKSRKPKKKSAKKSRKPKRKSVKKSRKPKRKSVKKSRKPKRKSVKKSRKPKRKSVKKSRKPKRKSVKKSRKR